MLSINQNIHYSSGMLGKEYFNITSKAILIKNWNKNDKVLTIFNNAIMIFTYKMQSSQNFVNLWRCLIKDIMIKINKFNNLFSKFTLSIIKVF